MDKRHTLQIKLEYDPTKQGSQKLGNEKDCKGCEVSIGE